jgi:hypothetical protein
VDRARKKSRLKGRCGTGDDQDLMQRRVLRTFQKILRMNEAARTQGSPQFGHAGTAQGRPGEAVDLPLECYADWQSIRPGG